MNGQRSAKWFNHRVLHDIFLTRVIVKTLPSNQLQIGSRRKVFNNMRYDMTRLAIFAYAKGGRVASLVHRTTS